MNFPARSVNKDANYSAAFITFSTSSASHSGTGLTFTTGRGNDIVCQTAKEMAAPLIGMSLDELFNGMGKTWYLVTGDAQFRWLGELPALEVVQHTDDMPQVPRRVWSRLYTF